MNPLDAEQEAIDAAVAALDDGRRREFYERAQAAFKDPDTYATLVYIFAAGLHHFYLQRWGRGLLDLACSLVGLLTIAAGVVGDRALVALAGAGIVVGVAISELGYLFRSQAVVKRYNLDRQREILGALRGEPPAFPPARH